MVTIISPTGLCSGFFENTLFLINTDSITADEPVIETQLGIFKFFSRTASASFLLKVLAQFFCLMPI
jgi:hypothetical protein